MASDWIRASYLPLIFSEDDMNAMLRVRAAFDPSGLCNPGKIIPMPRGCGEGRAVATQSHVRTGSGSDRVTRSRSVDRPGRYRSRF